MGRTTVAAGLTILLGLMCLGYGSGLAVMSVDIGSEWLKVAIVSPGVPMEIALNKESKRKTPMTIAFRDDERLFGEDAQIVGVRFPKNSFSYIIDLLGKSIDNPIVSLYRARFPHHDIIADEERNTIAFRLDESTLYTPEELLAQLLHKAKEMAENSAGQKIKEAVITVPGFFNQAERRAVVQAAELADLKVLQLINDYTAVALNYGIFHRNEINDSAQYIMFYDMGASTTTATIVSYQNVKTKERGYVETHPQVSILGVGYDRTLGGLEVQIRLQKYLAEEFDKLKKTKNSVFESPRAMAKLLKEAGRVKNVLSANADHYAQIEGLLDEQDFRIQVTREKLEELSADVLERVTAPIKMALDASQLSMDVVSQVILVGAGTRMPKVQEILQKYLNTELSKNINTDEAAVLGAVYKAADLSQGFKVKKFITKDGVLFPIQIVFDKSSEERFKQVRRMLFSRMNAYPQKKIITFNKRKGDFEFSVVYADVDYLPPHEVQAIGNLNLSTVALTGVAEALDKHAKEDAESKGIKAHFSMDDSGLLNLVNVELVSEKSTAAVEKDEGSEEPEQAEKTEEAPKEDVKPVHEEPEAPAPPPEVVERSNATNETKPEEKPANQTEKAEKKITLVTLKEPIASTERRYGPQPLDGDKLSASIEKIKSLELRDAEKARRETALNTLESFVIDAQQNLQSEEYKVATTPEEAEKISEACQKTSDWLYEEGFGQSAEVYEEKLRELQALTSDLYERVFEHRERPEVLAGMKSMLNGSDFFLTNMKNLNGDNKIFTSVEIETLEKTINDTYEFHQLVVKTVAEAKPHEPVKFKVRDIANKMAVLDREVKYLVNKAKIWKPKVEEVNEGNKTEAERNATSEANEEVVVEEASDEDKDRDSENHVEL